MLDSAQLLLIMRRAIAITVMLIVGLPFAAPLFAKGAETAIAACCRRDGKHHCIKTVNTGSNSIAPEFSADMKCPMSPKTFISSIHNRLGLTTSAAIFAEVVAHPALSPQTQSNYRISLLRSHQKRGPPAVVLA